jgi:hypothetical protein
MLKIDPERLLANIGRAETADLIDRVTAYRLGMEPQAVALMENELEKRGIAQAEIDAQMAEYQRDCLFDADGNALVCSKCPRPAVAEVRDWHRLWGVLPLFPRTFRRCKQHRSAS